MSPLWLKHGAHGDGTEGAQAGLSQTGGAGRGHSILETHTHEHTLSHPFSNSMTVQSVLPRTVPLPTQARGLFVLTLQPITSAHQPHWDCHFLPIQSWPPANHLFFPSCGSITVAHLFLASLAGCLFGFLLPASYKLPILLISIISFSSIFRCWGSWTTVLQMYSEVTSVLLSPISIRPLRVLVHSSMNP